MIDWNSIEHFTSSEFTGPMDPAFIKKLDRARTQAGVAFVITSSYRSDSDTGHGALPGRTVDIACTQPRARYCIVKALLGQGFHRIFLYDKHIHVDEWPDGDPRVMDIGISR